MVPPCSSVLAQHVLVRGHALIPYNGLILIQSGNNQQFEGIFKGVQYIGETVEYVLLESDLCPIEPVLPSALNITEEGVVEVQPILEPEAANSTAPIIV